MAFGTFRKTTTSKETLLGSLSKDKPNPFENKLIKIKYPSYGRWIPIAHLLTKPFLTPSKSSGVQHSQSSVPVLFC